MTWQLYNDAWDKTVELLNYDRNTGNESGIFEDYQLPLFFTYVDYGNC